MEKILAIEAVDGEGRDDIGYKVTTNKQVIDVLIDNHYQCCEGWGFFSTPDDPKDYIGARLLNVRLVDDELNVHDVSSDDDEFGYGREATFVNFETDRGVFQLTVYTEHNGYYSHAVTINANQLTGAR